MLEPWRRPQPAPAAARPGGAHTVAEPYQIRYL